MPTAGDADVWHRAGPLQMHRMRHNRRAAAHADHPGRRAQAVADVVVLVAALRHRRRDGRCRRCDRSGGYLVRCWTGNVRRRCAGGRRRRRRRRADQIGVHMLLRLVMEAGWVMVWRSGGQ